MATDPFVQALASVASDFAGAMVWAEPVTVAQIDPDTDTDTTAAGVTLGSATGVPALKRVRRRRPLAVGGGELGRDECRFTFAAAAVSWVPKARDQITDAEGVTWQVSAVETIAGGNLISVDVVIKR
jgi:hypothetical protein